jgi:outer membrane receptor protein involved in Fe transport
LRGRGGGWRTSTSPLLRLALFFALTPAAALAQPQPSPPDADVVVIGATPIPGSGVDRDKAPVETEVLNDRDLTRDGEPNLLRTLGQEAGPVNLDAAAGNPYQPTLFYHGFAASPLQGTSQGLAVYIDGVRFNTAFGDTVNFDLIPSLAIERLTLEGSNPLFGLNALGGALNASLKTGFTSKGGEADVSGGSFGQRQGELQTAGVSGDGAVYAAVSVLHQDGWRDLQSSDIQSFYSDLGWRHDRAEGHLSIRFANADLNGPGASPVELLAADPAAQFTAPNNIKNRTLEVSARGSYQLSETTSVQGLVYDTYFKQAVANGNASNDRPCGDGSGLLCDDDGYSTTLHGRTIPAFLGNSPTAYAELDTQSTETNGYGLAGEFVAAHRLLGLSNHAVAGVSIDVATTAFGAVSSIGGLTATTRTFVGPGVVIDEPGDNQPVSLSVADAAYGAFASDTLSLTPSLSVTLSGRFNDAEIDLRDRLGGDLSGDHSYSRFNPALGAAWQVTSWLTAYAGYAEANRAPTPAELSCANPADSCSLANFFVGDPNLKQVSAHTVEGGVRGRLSPFAGSQLSYDVSLYRTDLDHDIAFVNSVALGRAYFTNIGKTRRQGVDADASLTAGRWSVFLAYAHTEATYRSGFVESGGANPDADPLGNVVILPGDRLPGVPADRIKLGVEVRATGALTLGAGGVGQSGQRLVGDEANLTPPLPGFFVVNLNAAYQVTARLQLFVRVENAADQHYATYGTFSPTTSVFLSQAPNASNPRSYSPAAPVGAYGGLRIRF